VWRQLGRSLFHLPNRISTLFYCMKICLFWQDLIRFVANFNWFGLKRSRPLSVHYIHIHRYEHTYRETVTTVDLAMTEVTQRSHSHTVWLICHGRPRLTSGYEFPRDSHPIPSPVPHNPQHLLVCPYDGQSFHSDTVSKRRYYIVISSTVDVGRAPIKETVWQWWIVVWLEPRNRLTE